MLLCIANFSAYQRPRRERGALGDIQTRLCGSSLNERQLLVHGGALFPLSATSCPESDLYQLLGAHIGASGAGRGAILPSGWVVTAPLPSLLDPLHVISSS